MKLVKYDIAQLPKKAIRHNFGDKFGMVTIDEKLAATYTDDIAEECVKHDLPYFKKKEGVEEKTPAKKAAVTTSKKGSSQAKTSDTAVVLAEPAV